MFAPRGNKGEKPKFHKNAPKPAKMGKSHKMAPGVKK
jgi:hypothetical protein